MMDNLTSPALYSRVDQVGSRHGVLTVLGFNRLHRYPAGDVHNIWNVRCDCGRVFELQAQKVMANPLSCAACKGIRMHKERVNWKGGRYVPSSFLTMIKTTLVRAGGSRILDFELSIEYLDDLWEFQGGSCFYSDKELCFGSSGISGTASLDRTDCAKGYIEGNVRFVHKDINKMKWDLDENRFIELCREVATHAP